MIRHGELRQMFDTGLPIGDDVLREMLGQSADDKMKSIVTTIQKEQNEIIRTDRHRILIVQGAAGSGKTSVALQRVAYLLYKYRNVMSSENILLFSPNRLFNDYISTVLPELGEANMRQTTFQDYLAYTLGFEWKLENPYERMELVLGSEEDEVWRARTAGMAYKASTDFFGLIRRYLTLLKQEGMLFKTLSIRDKPVIPAERLVERFYGFEPRMSIEYRIEKMRRWLLDELEEKEEAYAKAVYRKMYANPRYLGTEPEMKAESRRKARRTFTPLVEMADRLEFADALGLYKRLFTDSDLLQRLLAEEPGAEAAVPGALAPAPAGEAAGSGALAEGSGKW
ncbi:UvrD-helicase domain-containing protein [Paenibacillus sp. CC-CFT747]|nr:UvrD-helicase domain-containing protein [Paenibacillus sp. CC-CFT747]